MTIPCYIGDERSDMRGIKPGWYGIDDDRQPLSGTFSEHRGMHHENHTADDRASGAQAAGLNHFLAKIRTLGRRQKV